MRVRAGGILLVAIRRAECACALTCFEKAFAAFTALLLGSKVFHVQQLRCSVVAHLRQVMFLMNPFWIVRSGNSFICRCCGVIDSARHLSCAMWLQRADVAAENSRRRDGAKACLLECKHVLEKSGVCFVV